MVARQAAAHEHGDLAQRLLDAREVADVEVDDVDRMDVRVDEAGDDEAAAEAAHDRVRADEGPGAVRVADVDQAPVPDRERLGEFGTGRRVDLRVGDDEIGWRGSGERRRAHREQ